MKKSFLVISIIACMVFFGKTHANQATANVSPAKFIFVFASKAYWDGQTQSCVPRDRGCCIHIGFSTQPIDGQITGEMNYSASSGIVFKFSKSSGITPKTLHDLVKDGKFYLDGKGTFSEEVIKILGLPLSYSIPAGYYPCSVEGDIVTVTLK